MLVSPEQLQELLKYCLDFGKTMLEDSGEFFPFGVVIGKDGKLKAVAGYDGHRDPTPQNVYRMIWDEFISDAKAGRVLATAIAANVNIPSSHNPPSVDGVRIHLETEGYSQFIYVPYTLAESSSFTSNTVASYGEPIPVDIPPKVFGQLNS